MSYFHNGQHFSVKHPISSISVNRNKVVFSDSSGSKSLKLDNTNQTREFLDWLLASEQR